MSSKAGIGSRASDEDVRTAVRVGKSLCLWVFFFLSTYSTHCDSKLELDSHPPPEEQTPTKNGIQTARNAHTLLHF